MKTVHKPAGMGTSFEQLLRTEAEYVPRLCLKILRLRLSIRQAVKELAR